MRSGFNIFSKEERRFYYDRVREFRDSFFSSFVGGLVDVGVKPNYLTLAGALMVIPFVYFFSFNPWLSFLFLLFALFFDGVDGVLARKMHIESEFGAILDVVVDYFVYFSVFFTLVFYGVVDGFWGGIHSVNYLFMQSLIVFANYKRIDVFPVIRSKFLVYFLFALFIFTGRNYFDFVIVFLSVYMFFTNLFILFRFKWELS